MPNGGKRPGAGRPKGSKSKGTLAKEAAREYYRTRLMAQIDDIADAHISRCKGVRYFVTRNKTGKYEIVTDPEKVVAALNGDDDMTGEFYTDKPDVQAIREALDRTLDRSKEQEQSVEIKGDLRILHEIPR